MNRIAHLPRNPHSKPIGFDAGVCVQKASRCGSGRRCMDTIG